ncbi:MAG: hypothetical protein JWQ68_2034, partial [Cryobacterium sp.]|nr:hypothetical protein [Cryobacterium sp.]
MPLVDSFVRTGSQSSCSHPHHDRIRMSTKKPGRLRAALAATAITTALALGGTAVQASALTLGGTAATGESGMDAVADQGPPRGDVDATAAYAGAGTGPEYWNVLGWGALSLVLMGAIVVAAPGRRHGVGPGPTGSR